MAWKPACSPGFGALPHVLGDVGGVEAQHAGGVRSVGVRRVQRGSVRAEGTVTEQVAGRADRPEFPSLVDAEQLAPVTDHLG